MKSNLKALLLGTGLITAAGSASLFMLGNTQQEVVHTSHWKVVPPGGYWNYPCTAGDTLYLDGHYTYMSFGKVSGAKDKPIVIMGSGNVIMSNGFNFSDCNYFHITGKINIENAPGTALSISGKSNHFEIDGVNIDTAFYFLWFKTEPADHPCDSSYWHSLNMDDLYVHDCNFNYCNQDGCYISSTDQNADRSVNCNGKIYYPLPATVSNIRFERVRMTNAQRTFLQISGCSGNNYIKNCYFNNAGFEMNPYQGAGIALGGNDIGKFEIAYDTIINTYLNNFYSYASGTVNFHNNLLDSADVVSGKINAKENASVLLSAKNATYNFYENQIGWSNNNVQLVVYGSFVNSCFSGLTNIVNATSNKITICSNDTKKCDTTYKVISKKYDSTVVKRDTAWTNKKGTITYSVKRTATYHKSKNETIIDTIKCD